MNNARRLAWQDAELKKLRDEKKALTAEVKALEAQLGAEQRLRAQTEEKYKSRCEKHEQYLTGYQERVQALKDTELTYRDALEKVHVLREQMKKEAAAQIARMKRENMFLNQ